MRHSAPTLEARIAGALYFGATVAGAFALTVASPQLLSAVFASAGLGWLASDITGLMPVPLESDLAPAVLLLALLSEALLTLWLVSVRTKRPDPKPRAARPQEHRDTRPAIRLRRAGERRGDRHFEIPRAA
jgi:hypothetical protein